MHTTEITVKERDYDARTSQWYDREQKFSVIHNGDWSGMVTIVGQMEPNNWDPDGSVSIELPSDLMIQCVAEMVRSYRMSRLEDLSAHDLVGLPSE